VDELTLSLVGQQSPGLATHFQYLAALYLPEVSIAVAVDLMMVMGCIK
jgi:hypothetical protein